MGAGDNQTAQFMTIMEYARHRGISHASVQEAIKRGRLEGAVFQDGKRRKIDVAKADAKWAVRKRPPPPPPGSVSESATTHRLEREEYQAKLARLDYEKKAGKLVEAESVAVEAFALARMVRDNMLNIPDRISHELAAEMDPHKIHIMLTKSMTEALEQLVGIDPPAGDGAA